MTRRLALATCTALALVTCTHVARSVREVPPHPLQSCEVVLKALHSRGPPQGEYAVRWAKKEAGPATVAVYDHAVERLADGGVCVDSLFRVLNVNELPTNSYGLHFGTWPDPSAPATRYLFSVTAGGINCVSPDGGECGSIELSGGMEGTIEWDRGWTVCNGCLPKWAERLRERLNNGTYPNELKRGQAQSGADLSK